MRDYVFVSDVVEAILREITKGENELIYIGTQSVFSVYALAKEIAAITKYGHKPEYMPKRSGELFRNFLNISKAAKVLRWKPRVDIKTGLKKTVEYFIKK
jgi:UDP-glucose 4-epimerase